MKKKKNASNPLEEKNLARKSIGAKKESIKNITTSVEESNGDYFKEIKSRIQRYNEHIDSFKRTTFDTLTKNGSYKEIEKIVNLFDKKNERGLKFMFHNNINMGHNIPNKTNSVTSTSTNNTMNGVEINTVYCNTEANSQPNKNAFSSPINNSRRGTKEGAHLKINVKENKHLLTTPDGRKSIDNNKSHSPHRKRNSLTSAMNESFNKDPLLDADFIYISSLKSKNEIVLSHPFVKRYFSYSTLDTIGKYFRINQTGGNDGTSSAYFNIKPDMLMDSEDEKDVARPVERTNEIHIFDRKKRTLVKKRVKLNKKMHGYATFLDGMRYVLVNDKLFITGGRDDKMEYVTVLTYDIKEDHLKRICDMNVARSYHTLEYNEIYKSLTVIGGENNKTCELLDLFTNRWQLIPPLNYPRANVHLYFDKNMGVIYSIFGFIGSITKTEYSSVVEALDLNRITMGWQLLDFQNKTDFDFSKSYYCLFPITDDKLLIYGGVDYKSFAVFDLAKPEVVKVDNKLMDQLRKTARQNARLSKIISVVNDKQNNV